MKKLNGRSPVAETPLKVALTLTEELEGRRNGRQHPPRVQLPSVVVGRVATVSNVSAPLVDFPGNTLGELVSARSLVPVTDTDVDRNVVLTFEHGDLARPIILGFLDTSQPKPPVHREVKVDDESLVLTAKKEVVIQCGKASITLTSAGKVLVRGEYLLSRSSGVNRIKGGSVQIN
jgi:hypothetical protein